jgi:cohesin loading factor subunit SCC2
MEVLKISKSKNRQRFLEKFCAQVNFDVSRLDTSEQIPPYAQFSRFILENIAFFEYVTIGEVQTTVAALEKIFTSTGATVAQAIEAEVFQVRMDALDSSQANGGDMAQVDVAPAGPTVDPKRLRQLTAGSMILLALWEARTYLRRLYGMGTTRREGKAKGPAKDLARAPVKVQNITGDKFWEDVSRFMMAMQSREEMMGACRAFVELMSVDQEFTIPDDQEDGVDGEDPATPENDEDELDEQPSTGRGRKRKASNTPGSNRKKPRASSQTRKRGRPRKQSVEVHDADGEFEEDVWY